MYLEAPQNMSTWIVPKSSTAWIFPFLARTLIKLLGFSTSEAELHIAMR